MENPDGAHVAHQSEHRSEDGFWLEELPPPTLYSEIGLGGYLTPSASPKGGTAPVDPRAEIAGESDRSVGAGIRSLSHTRPSLIQRGASPAETVLPLCLVDCAD